MSSPLAFFAVHADDVSRAREFYEGVFGWQFEPWGPPDFYLISTGAPIDQHLRGALQKRTEPLTGTGTRGFECSLAVPSVDETARAVESHGGAILFPKTQIPGVGWVVKFRDTEGNEVAAVQYVRREG